MIDPPGPHDLPIEAPEAGPAGSLTRHEIRQDGSIDLIHLTSCAGWPCVCVSGRGFVVCEIRLAAVWWLFISWGGGWLDYGGHLWASSFFVSEFKSETCSSGCFVHAWSFYYVRRR